VTVVGTRVEEMDGELERLRELTSELRTSARRLLECVEETGSGDRDTDLYTAAAIEELSLLGRVQHGMLLQFLACARKNRALPGGAGDWLAATQCLSKGHARTLARDANRVTTNPEVLRQLTEGRLSPCATRVIARYMKAVAGTVLDTPQTITDALTCIETEGVTEASRRIPKLDEQLDPEQLEELLVKQRARSFARMSRTDTGMYRLGMLLDPERAAHLMTGLDRYTVAVIRGSELEGGYELPTDVCTTVQIRAEAFVRMAQVFLSASDEQRGIKFSVPAILYATLDEDKNPTVETLYGDSLPPSRMPDPSDPAVVVLLKGGGRSVEEGNFFSRLANLRQRRGVALRERHCKYPGCTRPIAWSFHTHNVRSFKNGGLTALRNLTLLCPEHHTAVHRPGH
jgi:hypothetical protein